MGIPFLESTILPVIEKIRQAEVEEDQKGGRHSGTGGEGSERSRLFTDAENNYLQQMMENILTQPGLVPWYGIKFLKRPLNSIFENFN
jgi:hypothetical protein